MSQSGLRVQLLKKLWVHLTPKETYGLSSPDKIQRSGQTLGEGDLGKLPAKDGKKPKGVEPVDGKGAKKKG